jgi:hypothetical protein
MRTDKMRIFMSVMICMRYNTTKSASNWLIIRVLSTHITHQSNMKLQWFGAWALPAGCVTFIPHHLHHQSYATCRASPRSIFALRRKQKSIWRWMMKHTRGEIVVWLNLCFITWRTMKKSILRDVLAHKMDECKKLFIWNSGISIQLHGDCNQGHLFEKIF